MKTVKNMSQKHLAMSQMLQVLKASGLKGIELRKAVAKVDALIVVETSMAAANAQARDAAKESNKSILVG